MKNPCIVWKFVTTRVEISPGIRCHPTHSKTKPKQENPETKQKNKTNESDSGRKSAKCVWHRVEKVIASIYLDDFITASESSFGLLTHHLT